MLDVLRDVSKPVELRSLTVGETGRLARCQPKLPIMFAFDWRGVRFRGEVDRVEGCLVLRLSADVTIVPFSAEDRTRRMQILSLLKAGGGAAKVSLLLSPNNRLVVLRELELPKDASLTAHTLVTQTAAALLRSAPYLDLMVEFGLVEPKSDQPSGGTVKI